MIIYLHVHHSAPRVLTMESARRVRRGSSLTMGCVLLVPNNVSHAI